MIITWNNNPTPISVWFGLAFLRSGKYCPNLLLGEWFPALLSHQFVPIWSYFSANFPLLSPIEESPRQFVVGWMISGLVLLYHYLDLFLLACDVVFYWWIWPPMCSALLFHFLLCVLDGFDLLYVILLLVFLLPDLVDVLFCPFLKNLGLCNCVKY